VNRALSVVIGVALVLTGCTTATTSTSESPDEASATAESEQSPSPADEPSADPSPSSNTPEPITYADLVSGPVTTAEICDSYGAVLDQYGDIVAKRKKSLKGKDKDPYKAAKFANNNGWLYEDLAVGFERDVTASVTDALNTVSDGQAGLVESIDPYRDDSMQACGLDQEYSTVEGDVAAIDRQQASVVTAANNKPWYPKNFTPYGSDLALKWIDNAGVDCFSRCWYWTVEVISRDGCPSGLYGEMSIEQNGTAITWTNDSLSRLKPGQKGRMQFITYDDRAYGGTGSLSELNCY